MKIIFHIGMGKTGTSSVQAALQGSQSILSEYGYEYIGLWLGLIDQDYIGYDGFDRFTNQSEEALRFAAENFFHKLKMRKCSNFIYSNESVFSNIFAFTPFIKKLQDLGVEIKILIYVRPMHDWLPSAFTQWNAFHKEHSGKIMSFPEKGRNLAALYNNVVLWMDAFGEDVVIREFSKNNDIVSDISEVLELPLVQTEERAWERVDDAEIVLRAIFNDRIDAPALPHIFEHTTGITRNHPIRAIDDFVSKTLDFAELSNILKEVAPISDRIHQESGINIAPSDVTSEYRPPDITKIRSRLLDYILEISIQQSLRIQRLEKLVEENGIKDK